MLKGRDYETFKEENPAMATENLAPLYRIRSRLPVKGHNLLIFTHI